MHLTHLLRSAAYALLFLLLSDLISAANPHILWFACAAHGTVLQYMLVDLSLKINRTFLSAECCGTYDWAICIIRVIWGKIHDCLLGDLLVSICLPSVIQQKFILLLLADYRELNMKHSRKIDIFCWIYSCTSSRSGYFIGYTSLIRC